MSSYSKTGINPLCQCASDATSSKKQLNKEEASLSTEILNGILNSRGFDSCTIFDKAYEISPGLYNFNHNYVLLNMNLEKINNSRCEIFEPIGFDKKYGTIYKGKI